MARDHACNQGASMVRAPQFLISVCGLWLASVVSSPAIADASITLEAQKNTDAIIEATKTHPSSDFDDILKQVRSVLLSVQAKLKTAKLPPLKSVEIDLQTGVTTTVGGQITIFVITIGASTSNQTAQTMKFVLTPPTVGAAELATAIAQSTTPNFSAQFSAAIIAAAQAADAALANQQNPALELNTFTADIKFTIEPTVQGGVNTLTLLPVNLQANAKVTPTNTHEAVLTFAKPAPAGH
jgi:hypothetical protein